MRSGDGVPKRLSRRRGLRTAGLLGSGLVLGVWSGPGHPTARAEEEGGMPVVIIAEIIGGTAELDAAVVREAGADQQPPPGALFRATGPIPGGWRFMSGWVSAEAFDTWHRERLQPALAKYGVQLSRLEVWAVQSILPPAPP